MGTGFFIVYDKPGDRFPICYDYPCPECGKEPPELLPLYFEDMASGALGWKTAQGFESPKEGENRGKDS